MLWFRRDDNALVSGDWTVTTYRVTRDGMKCDSTHVRCKGRLVIYCPSEADGVAYVERYSKTRRNAA